MRKSICLLMAIVLLLSLCGCGRIVFVLDTPPTPRNIYRDDLTQEEYELAESIYLGTKQWENPKSVEVLEIHFISLNMAHVKIQYLTADNEKISQYYSVAQKDAPIEEGTMIVVEEGFGENPNEGYNTEGINKKIKEFHTINTLVPEKSSYKK